MPPSSTSTIMILSGCSEGVRMRPGDVPRGWWKAFTETLRDGYLDLLAAEEDASRIAHFHPTFVPGLLQTEDYARAITKVTTLGGVSTKELEILVRVKVLRQRSAFQSDSPKELIFLVDESALYRPIGGPQTMHNQLRHLLALVNRPLVTLIILPFLKPHPGHKGAFMLLNGSVGDTLSFEWPMGNTVVRDQPELARLYRALADELVSSDPESKHARDAIQEALRRS
jgi:hypothetical protein